MRKGTVALLILALMLVYCVTFFELTTAKGATLVVPDNYSTINQAVQNAADGDTILVKQGMYNETIIIDKAITLKGEDTNKTIINGNDFGTVIQIRHYNVTVTGFTLLFSLDHNSAHRYYIRPSADSGAYFVRHTGWEEGLAGVHLQNVQYCNITGNIVSDCGLGLWLTESLYNTVSGNIFVRNNNGLVAQTSWNNKIIGNTFLNGGAGICLPPKNVFLTGLVADQSSGYNTFTHNNFIGNQIAVESLSLVNTTSNIWNDVAEGNYWNAYNDTDKDDNGVGDNPYQIMAEYYTGGHSTNGVWKEQVYDVDNYPLTEPYDTASMLVVYQPATPTPKTRTEPPTGAPETDIVLIAIAVAFTVALSAAAAILHKNKNQKTSHLFPRQNRMFPL